MMENLVFKTVLLIVVAALLIYSCLQAAFLCRKFNMHRKEKALKQEGITPSSSELKSVIILSNDKKSVIETKIPNANWYHRLVNK